MHCYRCGLYLPEEEDVASHDCVGGVVSDEELNECATSLYQRLLARPSVSLNGAYMSTVSEGTKSDDMLRCGLSNVFGGPPLSLVSHRVLNTLHTHQFVAIANAALNRVKNAESDDYLHVSEPPLQYKLLAAALRQASRAEHVVALLVAMCFTDMTPHLLLPEQSWHRYDKNILSDLEFNPDPQVLKSLEAELRNISFDHRHDSDDALVASRSFLWKSKDEFIVSVLHLMVLSLVGADMAIALPPLSESEVSSWLPRFTKLVAVALGTMGEDVTAAARSAIALVNANPLASFATCRLAQALPVALTMESDECVVCALMVPTDCVVQCGGRVLCKLCYEASARLFARNPANQSDRDDHRFALRNFRAIIAEDVVDVVSRSIAAAEGDLVFDARFHCPLNASHQTPFHAPMPEHSVTPGAPVGIKCPECKIRWCEQCKCAEHPHAASCGEVINTKNQWPVYSDNMKKFANVVLGDLDSEVSAMKLAQTDHAAAVERRRALLQTQIVRIQREIADVDNAIRQIHQSNHAEMTWAGDGGWDPKVIGSRRCPHCGRQPIRRVSRCASMVCGQNSENTNNYQGGCLRPFNYTSPEAAYQPISTASQEAERAKLQHTVNQLTAHLAHNQMHFPPPVLANHWPSLSCSACKKGLLGDFHVQCYHCVPPYLLCVYCVRDNKHNEHAAPKKESGHVLTIRKA